MVSSPLSVFDKTTARLATTPLLLRYPTVVIVALAALARLTLLPLATLDSGDSASRVMAGWQWASDPHLISEGVWGPLHFYLIGIVLAIWPDPVWGATTLHLVLGALTPIVVYKVTLELFRNERAAFLIGIAYALYPMAIHVSLAAYAETPFTLLMGLAILYTVRARGSEATSHALLAGLFLGLASMLRYEAWMLMPIFALLMLPRWGQAAKMLSIALLHPVFWMVGNTIAHGHPLYGTNWAANWELNMMEHRVSLDWTAILDRIEYLFTVIARGMGPFLSLLVVLGVVDTLIRNRTQARWLLPAAVLLSFLIFALARGTIWVKPSYTATFGLLLIPFCASVFLALKVDEWSVNQFTAVTAGLIVAVGLFAVEPLSRLTPRGGLWFSQAVPTFAEQQHADQLLALMSEARTPQDKALISEFYGWHPTGYVSLQSKFRPANICTPNGAPTLGFEPQALQTFLRNNPQGLLITRPQGKLTALLSGSGSSARLANVPVTLTPIGTIDWPTVPDSANEGTGAVSVARYVVNASPLAVEHEQACDTPCPLSFCRAESRTTPAFGS